jgi:hypothetical protein
MSIVFIFLIIETINLTFIIRENEIETTGGFIFKRKFIYNKSNILALHYNKILLKNLREVPIKFTMMQNYCELYYRFYLLLDNKSNVDEKVKKMVEEYESAQIIKS